MGCTLYGLLLSIGCIPENLQIDSAISFVFSQGMDFEISFLGDFFQAKKSRKSDVNKRDVPNIIPSGSQTGIDEKILCLLIDKANFDIVHFRNT